MDDVRSLAHTKWNCKYHVVFAPKYRRKVFFEEKRPEIREILRKLCQWKGVEIIEAEGELYDELSNQVQHLARFSWRREEDVLRLRLESVGACGTTVRLFLHSLRAPLRRTPDLLNLFSAHKKGLPTSGSPFAYGAEKRMFCGCALKASVHAEQLFAFSSIPCARPSRAPPENAGSLKSLLCTHKKAAHLGQPFCVCLCCTK